MNTFYVVKKKENYYSLIKLAISPKNWIDTSMEQYLDEFKTKQSALDHIKSLHPAKSPLKWELVKVFKTRNVLRANCSVSFYRFRSHGIGICTDEYTMLNGREIKIVINPIKDSMMESGDYYKDEITRDSFYKDLHAALTELESQLKTEPKIQIFDQGESCLVVVEE